MILFRNFWQISSARMAKIPLNQNILLNYTTKIENCQELKAKNLFPWKISCSASEEQLKQILDWCRKTSLISFTTLIHNELWQKEYFAIFVLPVCLPRFRLKARMKKPDSRCGVHLDFYWKSFSGTISFLFPVLLYFSRSGNTSTPNGRLFF